MRNDLFAFGATNLGLEVSGGATATITNAEVELRIMPPTFTLGGLGFGENQGSVILCASDDG